MRREASSRYFERDTAVAIFVAHHFPTIGWHEHDFYELAVISTGRGIHESEHGVIPVEAGTVVFIPPGVSHEYRGCEDLIVYNCLFREELDEAELMWAFRDGHLSVLFNPDSQSSDRSHRPPVTVQLDERELRAVLDALEPIRAGTPEAQTRTGQLAHLLLALDVIATARRANDPTNARPTAPAVVVASLEMLSRDIAHPWTLEELSRQMYRRPLPPVAHLRQVCRTATDALPCPTSCGTRRGDALIDRPAHRVDRGGRRMVGPALLLATFSGGVRHQSARLPQATPTGRAGSLGARPARHPCATTSKNKSTQVKSAYPE